MEDGGVDSDGRPPAGARLRSEFRGALEYNDPEQREKERESRRAREDEEELQILRDRCEKLEQDRENQRGIVRIFNRSQTSATLTFFPIDG